MKTVLICLMLALGKIIVAQETETSTITIEVENITSDQGHLILGIYTKDNFLKTKPEYSQQVKIKDGKATLVFNDVPTGIYGISCFHDANDNQQMDFQPNGMPKEDYGLSNNPMLYGPPTWEDAKFKLEEGEQKISIRL
ncbi:MULTISPECIES: DUF2141 domain-containing protein [Mesonia]|uniref:Uncharacterized protein n=1 Tax=Mesonia oceanica TaxID=2687242 RepID=A0AC61Y455_9FLAO|nr:MULTISPECIES: DUF2141 domain-containing protein [Mesonia]MAN28033.1 hypothetical protein [Mesonia sp.]MAQ42436.1 hypothetical protein [Mesonia sp.]MBJ96742.1 hypothetical protein [Flavobacteriaceae bacterium]VVU99278.1 hypothetical protein FVB9532_00530 [Mesonia oceanica]|tara:strand:+ start:29246 stop:29662 length:417 start_codon:yes stop_codon:yes gene_type:complete